MTRAARVGGAAIRTGKRRNFDDNGARDSRRPNADRHSRHRAGVLTAFELGRVGGSPKGTVKGGSTLNTITTKDGVEIFYKDWGKGQPIVFSHGWPLSADDWDTQMLFFLKHGYRVIAHDRRGHGRSTQTGGGHDMDHLRRRPSGADRASRPQGCDACRPLDRRWRSGAVPGAPRRKPGGKSGDHQRGAAADGKDGDQSGRVAQGGF